MTTEEIITDDDVCEACARLYRFATEENKRVVLAMLKHFLASHPELQVISKETL